jgi:phosphoglycerate dehydrogenase-like enzyme
MSAPDEPPVTPGVSERIVGVIEDPQPAIGLLTPRPGVMFCSVMPDAPIPDAVSGAEALFVANVRSPFLRENWPRLKQLRWVHAGSAGVDRVLFTDLIESDVVLTNSRGVFDVALAEYVIGLMLILGKDFETTFVHQAEHRWKQRESDMLHGKTAVIVGVGPIARATARLVKAFGMEVRGIGRTARTGDPDFGDISAPDSLRALFAGADYVILVLPSTPETQGMIDEAALDSLKPTARLVNVGRASTLDQEALIRALREHRIAGAALDVVSPEPLPADSTLWDVPHLFISPHMSGDHRGWRRDTIALFENNLDRWLRGAPLLNVVDKHLGYAPGTEVT